MGFFNEFFGLPYNNAEWLAIKVTDKVYPNHAISILRLTTKYGKAATGWVDKSYEQYAYKPFCPYNLLVQISLPNQPAKNDTVVDMEAIQNFFIREIRGVSIAHLVARLVTDEGLKLEIYTDCKRPVIKHLDQLKDDPSLFQSFTYEIIKDPRWTAVSSLMKL
jgi:hypothetical protein